MNKVHEHLLDLVPKLRGSGLNITTMYEYVLKHGEEFTPAPLNSEMYRKGRMKRCFENSMRRVVTHGELWYVEGYAILDNISIPLHHGWNVRRDPEDGLFKVVDVTWGDRGTDYYGIPFDTRWALKYLADHDSYTLLDDYMNKFPLIRGHIGIEEARAWPKEL